MIITLPKRGDVPETNIFVKIIRKNKNINASWDRHVMFLIHGGPGGNHTLYADIEENLLEFSDLVIIDLRSCGLSDKSNLEFCTIEHNIDDIEAIRVALKISCPIIHGCSYGAIVALGYSIKYKNNLLKLILSSGAASGNFINHAKENLARLGTNEQIKAAQNLWDGSFESIDHFNQYYKIMAPLYIYNLNEYNQPPANKNNIAYNVELANYAFKTFLKTFDFRDRLNAIIVPVLIIAGKNDWIMDETEALTLHAGIINSKLVIFDNCGHFPWKDKKNNFLSEVSLFIT